MRWYGREPFRSREDPERCVVSVSTPPGFFDSHQCSRKRGHGADGIFCWQHKDVDPVNAFRVPKDRRE